MSFRRRRRFFFAAIPGGGAGGAGGGPPEIAANAVSFDGTNDYLAKTSALTGAASNKLFLASFWVKNRLDAVGTRYFLISGDSHVQISVSQATSLLLVFLKNPAGANVWAFLSTLGMTAANGWTHWLMSLDAAAGTGLVYRNDVLETLVSETKVNDVIDWATVSPNPTNVWTAGAFATGGNKINADLAELYVTNEFLDLSVVENRRKFISAGGKPVDLGADGSDPTGTVPLVYQSGPTVNWHTNKGGGGGFTEVGALTDATTSPSD